MDQRKFSKINGKGDRGGWVKLAHSGDRGVLHYLQQSFFRIKMALNIRRRYLAMTETVPVEGELVDTVDDIISYCSESSQFLGVFVANFDTKFFFDGHECFDDVKGVEAQVVV